MNWYEQENIRKKLMVFGRAMQGAGAYDVVIEPDPAKCRSGCCSFDRRVITVNPTLFHVPEREQYQLTKALLVHEAGHRRFTTPELLPPVVREVANILEDERIERRMWEEFVGIRWLIQKLAWRFHEEATPVDRASNIPNEVIAYFLQLRWAERTGQPVKGGLSPGNLILWEMVKPLVYESWQAETSETVNRNAKKIVKTLSNLKGDL